MKARALSAIAFTGLLAFGGTAYAAGSPNDNYTRVFPGDSGMVSGIQSGDTMGRAAFGTPSGATYSEGHQAYYWAFHGKSLQRPQAEPTGKAAYGTGDQSIDGNLAYHRAFRGD
jgi:hypothetical protein